MIAVVIFLAPISILRRHRHSAQSPRSLFRAQPRQLVTLVDALKELLAKDKAWVSAALKHLRKTLLGVCAGGRVPDGTAMAGVPEQRQRLFGFDLGKSVGLELVPSMQQLAELFLCSQGEEVSRFKDEGGGGGGCMSAFTALMPTHSVKPSDNLIGFEKRSRKSVSRGLYFHIVVGRNSAEVNFFAFVFAFFLWDRRDWHGA